MTIKSYRIKLKITFMDTTAYWTEPLKFDHHDDKVIAVVNEKIVLINPVNSEKFWPGRDLNTQPSDLESDALPLRHQATKLLSCWI